MELTDWIVVLAIALMAIAFYCSRANRNTALVDLVDRARRRRGTRLLVQGAIALWSALLTLDYSLVSPGSVPFGLKLSAQALLALALLLVVAGGNWSRRGLRLLRPRPLFSAC